MTRIPLPKEDGQQQIEDRLAMSTAEIGLSVRLISSDRREMAVGWGRLFVLANALAFLFVLPLGLGGPQAPGAHDAQGQSGQRGAGQSDRLASRHCHRCTSTDENGHDHGSANATTVSLATTATYCLPSPPR